MIETAMFCAVLRSNCCYTSCQLTFVTLPPLSQPTQSIEKKLKDRNKRKPQWFTRLPHSYRRYTLDTGDGSSQIWVPRFCDLSPMNVELHRTQLSLSGRASENFLEGSGMNHFSHRSTWTAG